MMAPIFLLYSPNALRPEAQVPACVLLVRNSTDAGFFHRLGPFPRVLLRRGAAQVRASPSSALFCVF
jgi:hypothetical protein